MFRHLKPGDRFQRMVGGFAYMAMEVDRVDEQLIYAHAVGGPGGYTFDRDTGVEEDADLRWGVRFGCTGSYIEGAQVKKASTLEDFFGETGNGNKDQAAD